MLTYYSSPRAGGYLKRGSIDVNDYRCDVFFFTASPTNHAWIVVEEKVENLRILHPFVLGTLGVKIGFSCLF